METIKSLSPLTRFFRLLSVDKQEVFSIYVYALFNGIVTLSLPLGIQAIINQISGGQTSSTWIVLVVFVIAGIAFTGVMQIMQITLTENLQRKIFTRSAFEFAYRIPRVKMTIVSRRAEKIIEMALRRLSILPSGTSDCSMIFRNGVIWNRYR